MKTAIKEMPKTTTAPESKSKQQGSQTNVNESKLQELFVDGLKDIYYAEKALVKALPKMIKNATAPQLIEAIKGHLEETKDQVIKLESVFSELGLKAQAKKCDAMDGLLKEATGIMEECEKGMMRDAGIITAAQKVEHYEIATYGTLSAFAGILNHSKVADMLHEILEQEKNADLKLTEVTSMIIKL